MPLPRQSLRARRRLQEFQAVCFDLDGVLIDTMPLHALAWQQALRPLGLSVSCRRIYAWEGESGMVTARTLLSSRGTPRPSLRAKRELLAAKEQCFRAMASRAKVNRTLARLVALLDRRRTPLGLVTGTSRDEVRRAVPASLLTRFDVVVTGDRVRRGKPHPEPYRTAFRRLRVRPERAIVVENAPYGIRSARRAGAGFVAALASSLPAKHLFGADAVAETAEDLAEQLKRLMAVD